MKSAIHSISKYIKPQRDYKLEIYKRDHIKSKYEKENSSAETVKIENNTLGISIEELYEIQSKDLDEGTKILCVYFSKNKYPTKTDICELAKRTGKSIKKVETWFKNRRRSMANRGLLPQYLRKKIFKKNEIKILKKFFHTHSESTYDELEELAKNLNSTVKHIKNWYAYNKKKHNDEINSLIESTIDEDLVKTLSFDNNRANNNNISSQMPISTVPVSSNQMLYEMQVPYFPKTEDMSTNNSSQSPQIFHRPPSINNIQNQQNMGTPFFVMPQNQVYPYYQINQGNQQQQPIYFITPLNNQFQNIPTTYFLIQNQNQNSNLRQPEPHSQPFFYYKNFN